MLISFTVVEQPHRGCHVHIQYIHNVVLVSYPERGIKGVNCRLGVLWDGLRDDKKAGRYPLARQILLSLCAANAGLRHSND